MRDKGNTLFLPATVERNRQIELLIENGIDLIEAAMAENKGFSCNLSNAIDAMQEIIDEVQGKTPGTHPDDRDFSDPNAEHRLTGKQMGVL